MMVKEVALAAFGVVLVGPSLLGSGGVLMEELGPPFVEGSLEFMSARLEGDISIHAEEAVLSVNGPSEATASGAHLQVTTYELETYETEVRSRGTYTYASLGRVLEETVTEQTYEEAIVRFKGDGDGRLMVWPTDQAESGFDMKLQNDTGADVVGFSVGKTFVAENRTDVQYSLFAPTVAVGQGVETFAYYLEVPQVSFEHAEMRGVSLVLDGGMVVIEHPGGNSSIETGTWPIADPPPGHLDDHLRVRYERRVFVVVDVVSGDAAMRLDQPALETFFLSNEPSWIVNGTVQTDVLDGHVRTADSAWGFRDEPVGISGNLILESRPLGESDEMIVSSLGPGWDWRQEGPPPEVKGSVAGEATGVWAGDTQLLAQTATQLPIQEMTVLAKITVVLMAIWFVVRISFAAVIALVARQPLEHPRRRKIYEFILEVGIGNVNDIHATTKIPVGSIVHHLRVLSKSGHIQCIRHNGGHYRVCFPATTGLDHKDLERLANLTGITRRRVADAILEDPGMTRRAISGRVGIDPSMVSRHMAKLHDAGLIVFKGKYPRRYLPSPLLETWNRGRSRGSDDRSFSDDPDKP